jgi:ribosomal protein S18 acetylase RimI-like enzyme
MLPCSEILVIEEDVICGFIGITDKSYIAGLFISKQFQGRGYGTILLEECQKHHSVLILNVYAKNTQAINFYHKHGFKITDEKKNSDTNEVEYTMQWSAYTPNMNFVSTWVDVSK